VRAGAEIPFRVTEMLKMFSRSSSVFLIGLLVGGAALLGVACSDGSKSGPGADGGAAGEAAGGAAPVGGQPRNDAGQGGAPDPGGGGGSEAGAVSNSAGAGGEPELGAAGAGPLACEPTGNVGVLTLSSKAQQYGCRGGLVATSFNGRAEASFTCCGVSDTPTPYALVLAPGTDGIGGRTVVLQVPASAPSGLQHVAVTCGSGEAINTIDFVVLEEELPIVSTTKLASISPDQSIEIEGTWLAGTIVEAIPLGNAAPSIYCKPDAVISNNTRIVCGFSGEIAPGDYVITVTKDGCGAASTTLPLTVVPPT
jgi:hypothetical protein